MPNVSPRLRTESQHRAAIHRSSGSEVLTRLLLLPANGCPCTPPQLRILESQEAPWGPGTHWRSRQKTWGSKPTQSQRGYGTGQAPAT